MRYNILPSAGSNGLISYSLLNDGGGKFEIGLSTGVLSLVATLDKESQDRCTLTHTSLLPSVLPLSFLLPSLSLPSPSPSHFLSLTTYLPSPHYLTLLPLSLPLPSFSTVMSLWCVRVMEELTAAAPTQQWPLPWKTSTTTDQSSATSPPPVLPSWRWE